MLDLLLMRLKCVLTALSGVILSRATQSRLEKLRQEEGPELYDQRWESLTASSCCGDEIIARAFLEVEVALTPSWPRIQGETVSTLDWTDKHWCSPAVTWHHVSPTQVDAMWQYQANWVKQNVSQLHIHIPHLHPLIAYSRAGPSLISTKTSLMNLSLAMFR